jgi:hypothetical protein
MQRGALLYTVKIYIPFSVSTCGRRPLRFSHYLQARRQRFDWSAGSFARAESATREEAGKPAAKRTLFLS